MHTIVKPTGFLGRMGSWALRSSLCVSLSGCAAHRLAAPESPAAETHLVHADERSAFRACVDALQQAGYKVDAAEAHDGVIRASLVTHERLGEFADGGQDEGHDAMKAWQVGLIGLTGAALTVGGLIRMDQGSDSQAALGMGVVLMSLSMGIQVPSPPIYEYQIAIQLLPMEANTTQVRVLLEGTERQDGEDLRSGPMNAPGLIKRLYSSLDQSVRGETQQEAEPAITIY